MEIREHKCDICEKVYGTREEVAGTITVDGPKGTRAMFPDVCEKCSEKVLEFIGELAGIKKSK